MLTWGPATPGDVFDARPRGLKIAEVAPERLDEDVVLKLRDQLNREQEL